MNSPRSLKLLIVYLKFLIKICKKINFLHCEMIHRQPTQDLHLLQSNYLVHRIS